MPLCDNYNQHQCTNKVLSDQPKQTAVKTFMSLNINTTRMKWTKFRSCPARICDGTGDLGRSYLFIGELALQMSSAACTIRLLTHGEDEKGDDRRRSHVVGSCCLRWRAGVGRAGRGNIEWKRRSKKSLDADVGIDERTGGHARIEKAKCCHSWYCFREAD